MLYRSMPIISCLIICSSLIAISGNIPSQQYGETMQPPTASEPMLADWLRSLSIAESEFVPAQQHSALLFEYLEQSRGTTGMFLKHGADPWRGAMPTEWTAHAAPPGGIDLLRTEYTFEGMDVLLLEGRNFMLTMLTPSKPGLAPLGNLDGIVASVMKTESTYHHWRFKLPIDSDSSQGELLITNEGAPRLNDLTSRHDRADILLREGGVCFVFYKRIEQLEDFLPSDTWFSPALRSALGR